MTPVEINRTFDSLIYDCIRGMKYIFLDQFQGAWTVDEMIIERVG